MHETLGHYGRYLLDNGARCDVVHTYRNSPPAPAGYDMLLIGGTPDSAYNRSGLPYLAQVFETIGSALDAKIPCFGVCCGAQLLAESIGGTVYRNPEMEIGGYRVTLTAVGQADPLLEGFPASLPVFHWHGDTFKVPPGASLLAEGEKCRNQLFRYGNVVGVQFHLEVAANEARSWTHYYAHELNSVSKTPEEVIAECEAKEYEMQKLAARLMQNYLALIRSDAGRPG
ncbi:MAG: type 1 glutamine amidotransferase [Desulfobacterales bacterium]|nr:type 1 glutamine amidotransferase [Desulfobacterales bacterium]